jgi:hypothetical protein
LLVLFAEVLFLTVVPRSVAVFVEWPQPMVGRFVDRSSQHLTPWKQFRDRAVFPAG